MKAIGEGGNRRSKDANKSGRWLRKSWSDNSVLSTGTCIHLKAVGNEETSQPPLQTNRAGTCEHLKETGNGKLCRQIRQVGREIFVRQLYPKHNYRQTSKGNWEGGNWTTTCADMSSRWLRKSWSENYVLSTGACKHLKATRNGKTGQPSVQTNQASG
ncbi:hypothetical protein GBA52_024958 [Prunus armeniaca]|nr:hypothetical protein GBA52_024958 [Prunus armeniaca]